MNKVNTLIFKLLLPALLFSIKAANAQKLPNVQETGLRAPSKVKIDGKLTEWNDHLQAHNRATDIFYTMANDDDNLYLIVQATDDITINRIVGGGVTLTIQKSGKKNDKDNISITYPVIDSKSSIFFNLKGKKGVVADTSAKAADSVMMRNNKVLDQKCKWIRVTGIEGLDTLISVYNDDGIKAAGLFNNKKVYTFELSIALKHLKLSASDATKFTYHMLVNGAKPVIMTVVLPPGSTPEQIANGEAMNTKFAAFTGQLSDPTDFWGEYTLVKK